MLLASQNRFVRGTEKSNRYLRTDGRAFSLSVRVFKSVFYRIMHCCCFSNTPQRSIAPNEGVRVVVIYFGVITMYSKYKLVLSISVISGKIIHCFITSLKERERI